MTDFEPAVRRIVGEITAEQAATATANTRMVTVHVAVGEPECGHWCPTCLLPSAAEMSLDGIHDGGVVQLGRIRVCPDCGQIERAG